MSELTRKRPEYRNIHAFKDLPSYRWPMAALVSGMHRISGLLMFLLLPLIVWLFDTSVSSEISHEVFQSAFSAGIGFAPGWFVKLVVLVLIWSYLHHLFAGLRFLLLDVNHKAVSKEFGKSSAIATLVVSIGLTLILGAKLFGLY
ncbi:MAG: succinate dehydrogenase, cytochrome b556 subunit [Hydrogenophaga sp.]|uniref:succinate dehydrogenase, cytochrome b556 subunit n=1 Tax=Hydrogenophaga sp. TaxID=1904254 RepID=UPI000ED3B6CC|nr:succinate dehydrogenase, cytochrome b556 subunit [Hydrogenophaga sp.]MDD3786247.1 succinate dehydrogenase, cytochrome b556 subunit [Hydrogenophaga sp.]HAJ13498.1 succinate dehydrogenase, cytochrome b556 subunit [Comamonadaceae bacterium]